MYIYLPIAEISMHIAVVIGLGGGVGFLSGMFGVGGVSDDATINISGRTLRCGSLNRGESNCCLICIRGAGPLAAR